MLLAIKYGVPVHRHLVLWISPGLPASSRYDFDRHSRHTKIPSCRGYISAPASRYADQTAGTAFRRFDFGGSLVVFNDDVIVLPETQALAGASLGAGWSVFRRTLRRQAVSKYGGFAKRPSVAWRS